MQYKDSLVICPQVLIICNHNLLVDELKSERLKTTP